MKNARISWLMAILITGGALCSGGALTAEAAEQEPTFSLEQMVVTATRYEKKDVDVPASTAVLTHQDLLDTGANNLATALAKVPGLAYKSFGPSGSSMGTMINEINIRGVSNGTLVLMNGSPISWRGKYNLESIPVESIERVEIVKGGGSVLYGSEAMGGVVNIITKKGYKQNSVEAGFGNLGQQNYKVNVGNDKFTVNYGMEKWGSTIEGLSFSDVNYTKFKGETRTDVRDVKKDNVGISYNFNDRLSFAYNYSKAEAGYNRYVSQVNSTSSGIVVGDQFNGRLYTNEQNIAQLNYDDKDFKAKLYYNDGSVESEGPTYITSKGAKSTSQYNTKEKNKTYGFDLQKNWELGKKTKTILGVNYKNEKYESLVTVSTKTGKDYSRDNWGVYGQVEHALNDADTVILSARETWTTKAAGDQNYNNFSAAGQFVHKLGENDNIYASVGQSFIMPTFAQMYGASETAIANPGLKPQTGMNYEIGWKKVADQHSWKVALYHMDIKDNITATWKANNSSYTYTNEDFKNTGIEVTCDIQASDGLKYNWGFNYSDPKVKGDKKPYWDRKFGRVQFNGGITYAKEKVRISLQGSLLADRVGTPSSAHSEEIKPYFLTSLSTTYSPDKVSEITLSLDNVLNRHDNLSHSGGSAYYATPINFLLSYKYKF